MVSYSFTMRPDIGSIKQLAAEIQQRHPDANVTYLATANTVVITADEK